MFLGHVAFFSMMARLNGDSASAELLCIIHLHDVGLLAITIQVVLVLIRAERNFAENVTNSASFCSTGKVFIAELNTVLVFYCIYTSKNGRNIFEQLKFSYSQYDYSCFAVLLSCVHLRNYHPALMEGRERLGAKLLGVKSNVLFRNYSRTLKLHRRRCR